MRRRPNGQSCSGGPIGSLAETAQREVLQRSGRSKQGRNQGNLHGPGNLGTIGLFDEGPIFRDEVEETNRQKGPKIQGRFVKERSKIQMKTDGCAHYWYNVILYPALGYHSVV